jgi:hypothetical protein
VIRRGPDWILEVLTKWGVKVKRPGHHKLEELMENEFQLKAIREFFPDRGEGAREAPRGGVEGVRAAS